MASDRLSRVIKDIDAANAADPHHIQTGEEEWPAELVYGQRMSAVLSRLIPNASELLDIAVRAQHIERWTIPRSQFPMDRGGYLRWRNELKRFHAARAAEIMARHGYAPAECDRVQSLIRKDNFKRDEEAQALEDTACLVFLEFYADEFAAKHDRAKMVTIIRKTWVKMSDRGQAAALALSLSPTIQALVQSALAE